MEAEQKVRARRQNKIKYINCTIRKRKVLEEIKIFVKFNEETKKLKWVNKKDGDIKKIRDNTICAEKKNWDKEEKKIIK